MAVMASRMQRKASILLLALLFVFNGERVTAEETLLGGSSLDSGEFLENGPYQFIMQPDCNLVLYLNRSSPLWSSGTRGQGSSCQAVLQNDGNLVVFSGSDVVWTSRSVVGPNSYRLVVQTDGNVVIYGGPIWATNTAQSRRRLF